MKLIEKKYMLSGGINPLDLCDKYGCPLYVYDTTVIEAQYKRLMNAFGKTNLRLFYACKALTNIQILGYIRELGAGLDAVSINEIKLGLKAGYSPVDIMFTPSCVSLEEIAEAVALGIRINIDNISILEQFAQRFPDKPVGIRINPHIMAGGHQKMSVGHIDSKFGISIHQLPHVLRIVEATGIKVAGLHMHTGSDILNVGVFLAGAEILFNAARSFPDLEFLDFGSGFKVPYKEGDIETDVESLGHDFSEMFLSFCKDYGRDLQLIFEPGKFLVSAAGFFFVRTNVVKPTISSVFVGVDSGMNHLIRPMFYDSYHQIVNVTNTDEKPRIYNVVGYICETDTFGVNRIIPEVIEGDILCFFNAGAYGYEMASNFNSRLRPAEVMIKDGKDYLIRRRETFEDLVRLQIGEEL
jgi:diaminopimelate decarboxylase